jgi:hypothetical protein
LKKKKKEEKKGKGERSHTYILAPKGCVSPGRMTPRHPTTHTPKGLQCAEESSYQPTQILQTSRGGMV